MTSKESQKQPVSAVIIEPTHPAASLEAIQLKIASQAAPYRLRPAFGKILDAMNNGQTLEDAVLKSQPSMSGEARSLFSAAMKLPDPTRFLLDVATTNESNSPLHWSIRLLLVYPLVLIGASAAFCSIISASLKTITHEVLSEFGMSGLDLVAAIVEDQLNANLAIVALIIWSLVVVATIRLCGPRWSFMVVIGGLPLLGKPLRWISLSELLARYGSTFRQINETSRATEIFAASYQNSELETVSRLVHQRVLDGTPLGTAISQCILTDGLSIPVVLTLDRTEDLSSMCERTSNTLKLMAEARYRLISAMMPLLVLVTIATIALGTLNGATTILIIFIRLFYPLVTIW